MENAADNTRVFPIDAPSAKRLSAMLEMVADLHTKFGARTESHYNNVAVLRAQLAREEAAFEADKTEILDAVRAARREYDNFVSVLARQLIVGEGKFDFNAQLGLFVERRTP